jgi:cyanate permease
VHEATTRKSIGTAHVPPFPMILRQRALWGTALGVFGGNYSFFFVLAWLPTYLVKARGLSMDEMATIASPAYALSAVMAVVGGFGIDRWVRRGGSVNTAYKGLLAVYYVVALVTMIGMALLPTAGSISCLYAYQFFGGLSSPCLYGASQIFAGPSATGRWVGVQNLCGNLSGILAPALTGVLVDASGSYVPAFVVAGLTSVVALAGWVIVTPTIKPIEWLGLSFPEGEGDERLQCPDDLRHSREGEKLLGGGAAPQDAHCQREPQSRRS